MSEETPKEKPASVTIKLGVPIPWGKEKGLVDEVVLERPKGKHLKHLSSDVAFKDLMRIASSISDYPPSFFEEMDGSDCFKVTEAINDFLDTGQETGATASD